MADCIGPSVEGLGLPYEGNITRRGHGAQGVPGARVSHAGERCSFAALLHAFDLHTPALDRLADVVRGADTLRFGLAGPAAGLRAISLGLSRVYRDDQAMLRAALPLYDALYAWCRDGQQELQGWASHGPQGMSA